MGWSAVKAFSAAKGQVAHMDVRGWKSGWAIHYTLLVFLDL